MKAKGAGLAQRRNDTTGDGRRGDTGPGDTRPYLCIPYWAAPRFPGDEVDIGFVRALPNDVVSWECPGIHASPYEPGKELEVTVDVRNSGHGNTPVIATVVVYWADPTVGFAKPHFFAVGTVAAPPMRDPSQPGVVNVTMRATIPAWAPNHVCLLAYVTHSLDPATLVMDPINDRHWAQRNLIAVSTAKGPVLVPFVVANPLQTEGVFELKARVYERRELELLSYRMKLEPTETALRMRIADGLGKAATEAERNLVRTNLALGAGKQRRYSLVFEPETPLIEDRMVAIEVTLVTGGDRDRIVGSLGIVVTGKADPFN
ncbi:hypothetical protein ACXU4B_03720 [Dyella soli]|uniref:CARDB domain-containing protein n=1 Tax=Dyella soli TaxID=522319 RepID=A0A4R0YN10_9GAMM|nr:hypothetical protein [Dyella soli]TCI10146.1 hypothetical protein EZM97_14605 [Dyella soli]